MMLGDFEITALSDGILDLKPGDCSPTPRRRSRALQRSFEAAAVPTSVNAYLVNTGDKLVLIDAGAAKLFGPTLGNLLANLAAAGYKPEQVDAVLITHMHGDHVGGLVADGKIAFPNATVHAEQRDAAFWLDKAQLDKAPEAMKDFFRGAQMSLAPTSPPAASRPSTARSSSSPASARSPRRGIRPGTASTRSSRRARSSCSGAT